MTEAEAAVCRRTSAAKKSRLCFSSSIAVLRNFSGIALLVTASTSTILITTARPTRRGLEAKNALSSSSVTVTPPQPEWTQWFEVPVDHFDDAADRPSFKIKVLGLSKFAAKTGPIFFYSGNEGSIGGFWNNTGLPFSWAAEFQADIVFAEHRYYGSSLPFGDKSFDSPEHMQYLRVEQAIADYARFMEQYNTENKKVVVMGGSYGGILASLMRQKYPTLFHAAIAASAPIPQAFNLKTESDNQMTFYESVTHSAKQVSQTCPGFVRQAFQELETAFQAAARRTSRSAGVEATSTSSRPTESETATTTTLDEIRKKFQLCQNSLKPSEWSHFMQYARNAWTEMAMCDYPYATDFLAKLPAWPIKKACELVDAGGKSGDPVQGLADAVALPYQSEPGTCLDMYKLFVECADQTGCGTDNDAKAWDYQMCADMNIVVASDGEKDMFPKRDWTLKHLENYCVKKYNVLPRPTDMAVRLGAYHFDTQGAGSISNIIYSNGLLDPWHPGGYLQNLTDSVVALIIPNGAHHLDLRLPDEINDPADVVGVRLQEKKLVKMWLGSSTAEKQDISDGSINIAKEPERPLVGGISTDGHRRRGDERQHQVLDEKEKIQDEDIDNKSIFFV
ncbi:unnamed protein product [Amoebophrya sp. A120]|nr:unnamed protein product [Amoebophrya sp. A120]|eukprot:GSA120T00010265001.1